MDHRQDDGLDKVKRGLYSRKGIRLEKGDPRSRRETGQKVSGDWSYDEAHSEQPRARTSAKPVGEHTRSRWLTIFIIISAGVFLLAVGTFIYRFAVVGMFFSPRNVTIEVEAPRTAGAGEEIEFRVSARNDNRAPLQNAELFLEFPEGTYAADEEGAVLERLSREIGTIESEGSAEEEFNVFLFGEEGEDLEVEIVLEYTSASSSATLSQEEIYSVNIASAPVTLTVNPELSEVQSGSETEIEVDVVSNTNTTLKDLILTVEYPRGFTLRKANPAPIEGERVWDIGDLEPRESKTVTLNGSLEGHDGEERFFIFNVGSETKEKQNQITRLFAKAKEGIAITLPSLALQTEINKNASRTVSVPAGTAAEVAIDWKNNLSDDILNLEIEAAIDESFIEERSVNVKNGFYRSSEETVVWNRSTKGELGTVRAGASDTVTFSFMTRGFSGNGSSNAMIPITIRAHAQEPQSGSSTRSISNEITREIRLASSLLATQSLSYQGGVFNNSGPTPPRANEVTTYTVTWRVASPANEIEDVVMRAALPTYVDFVEAESDSVSVNSLTNEVVWNAGAVSGSSALSDSVDTSFQVSFEASSSQVGNEPVIIREAQVEGVDAFSGDRLWGSAPALRTDDLLESGAGSVVE